QCFGAHLAAELRRRAPLLRRIVPGSGRVSIGYDQWSPGKGIVFRIAPTIDDEIDCVAFPDIDAGNRRLGIGMKNVPSCNFAGSAGDDPSANAVSPRVLMTDRPGEADRAVDRGSPAANRRVGRVV